VPSNDWLGPPRATPAPVVVSGVQMKVHGKTQFDCVVESPVRR
jgi:hypothetical protein